MRTETVEQYLARGGQIIRCPRAFAQEGYSPQSPDLTAVEIEEVAKHYDKLEEDYKEKWRRSPMAMMKNRTHLFIRLAKERLKDAIVEEVSNDNPKTAACHS